MAIADVFAFAIANFVFIKDKMRKQILTLYSVDFLLKYGIMKLEMRWNFGKGYIDKKGYSHYTDCKVKYK